MKLVVDMYCFDEWWHCFELWPPIIQAQLRDRIRLPVIAMQVQHGAVGCGAFDRGFCINTVWGFEQLIASSVALSATSP